MIVRVVTGWLALALRTTGRSPRHHRHADGAWPVPDRL